MHIIIAGTARSGKTTLSMILSKKGFIHYKMDGIKRGICEAYNLYYEDWDMVSPIMAKIINRIILDTRTDITDEKENICFDVPFLYPKDVKLIDTTDTIVIFLGYADLTGEENFEQIRKNDTKNLWTYNTDDQTLKKYCSQNVEFSKYLKHECKKYNIKYFDTSKNREEILTSALKYIENHLK